MRRNRHTLFCLALLFAAMPAALALSGPGAEEQGVLTDSEAVLLLPPAVVAGPQVRTVEWSGDGRFLLAVQDYIHISPQMLRALSSGQPPQGMPPGETRLIVWNGAEQRAVTVWKGPLGQARIEEIHWLPGSSVALATVWQEASPAPGSPVEPKTQRSLLWVSGASERARVVTALPDANSMSLSVSPALPLAVLISQQLQGPGSPPETGGKPALPTWQVTLQTVRENGTPGAAIRLPANTTFAGWSEEGGTGILMHNLPSADPKQKPAQAWHTYDPKTGRIRPLTARPKMHDPATIRPDSGSLRLRPSTQSLKEGDTTRTVHPLWLESATKSEMPRALVAADVERGEISPRKDAVLFVSRGSVWVVPLARVPRPVFEAMRDRARQMMAMSNAKQCGLALIMYAQDFDETLPAPDGINDRLMPYLKNDAVLQGFTYTYGGGKMSDISAPAETVLGYVTGPGGKAVIFADGHVKWKEE